MNASTFDRMFKLLLGLAVLVTVGTWGYMRVEGWSAEDGFYMMLMTISTVGYGEVRPLSSLGRFYTSGLILCCLIGMTYWTASFTSFIVEHNLNGDFARRRMQKMISKLSGHVVICGAGTLALHVIERLTRKRISVVVIDPDMARLNQLKKGFRNILVVEGDPTNELTLAEANILSAQAVVACLKSEVDNLLIGITCKDIGANIAVYARSNDPQLGNRMRKSGIDEVISPSQLVGDRIADLVVDRMTAVAV